MIKIQYLLYGVEVSASTAELHFVNWILALEQEHNPIALNAVNGQRCALNASHAFSFSMTRMGVVSPLRMIAVDEAIKASGLYIVYEVV